MSRAVRSKWVALGLGLTALGAVYTPPAQADGMRCGNRLISDGDLMYEVKNVCGVPDQATQRTERRIVSRVVQSTCYDPRGQAYLCTTVVQEAIEVLLDEWYYDFGRSVLVRTVTFEGGRLVRVVTGSYGTKDT
ncbi:MAG: hypothetical protein RLZZ450_4263 [Pseudomonadota bacterium]|jgi:hypothetical protein